MSIINDKKEIFGDIAALNTINDGLPKLSKSGSLESDSNSKDPMKFLADVLVVLAELNALKKITVDVITYQLPRLENEIKDALRATLKENCGCDINPSIPDNFKSSGSGIELGVKDIDFFDIMKVNPSTSEGGLVYSDVSAGVNSKDFNTYLNATIQVGSTEVFGASVSGNDIIDTKFEQTNVNGDNNMLNFKANQNYDTGKSMSDFNNDYIDSISLFGNPDTLDSKVMLNLIMEELFSSFSSSEKVNKSKEQIKKEVEVKKVLKKMIESDDLISPETYSFTNEEISEISREVDNNKKGILETVCCGQEELSIPIEQVFEINNNFDSLFQNDKANELKVVEDSLDGLAQTQATQVSSTSDSQSIKYNFFKEIIDKLMLMLMTQIISPKFTTLLMINFTISNGGVTPEYNSAIDLIKENENIFKAIKKRILQSVIAIILIFVIRLYIKKLIKKKLGDKIEKANNYARILFSYLPVNVEYKELLSNLI